MTKRRPSIEEQVEALAKTLWESPYSNYVRDLLREIQGKIVASSIPGKKGYLLCFGDGSWLACYLTSGKMRWKVGAEEPGPSELRLVGAPRAGSSAAPSSDAAQRRRVTRGGTGKKPYIMTAELTPSHGWPVTNVTIGIKSFSLCFPRGMQLQPRIRSTPSGGKLLRVYWERW